MQDCRTESIVAAVLLSIKMVKVGFNVDIKKKIKSVDAIFWFVGIFFILSLIFVPGFAQLSAIKSLLLQACVLIIISCGVHLTVLNGGVDFTSTALLALTTVVGGSIMSTSGKFGGSGFSIFLGIVVMLLIGVGFGIINGFSVVTFKMPSFIVTMATQMLVNGLAVVYTGGSTVTGIPDIVGAFGSGSFFVVPYLLIVAVIVAVCIHILLSKNLLGRQLYAVGTNPKTSFISGISVKKTIFKVYVISGLCAAIAGVVELSYMQSGSVNYGSTMFNDIMGSIIVGGTSPFGGRGKVINTVMGALLIQMISSVLNIMNVPYYMIILIKGLIILVAASLDLLKTKKSLAQ